jgi:hypothetical protein
MGGLPLTVARAENWKSFSPQYHRWRWICVRMCVDEIVNQRGLLVTLRLGDEDGRLMDAKQGSSPPLEFQWLAMANRYGVEEEFAASGLRLVVAGLVGRCARAVKQLRGGA